MKIQCRWKWTSSGPFLDNERSVPLVRWAGLVLLLLVPTLLTGCIERWLFVRSQPPGARIFLDSVEVGTTPQRIPFDHYGTRELLLRYEGDEGSVEAYESVVQTVTLHTPWYQWFPIDLFVENLWPWTIIDEHTVDVTLKPVDIDELYEKLEKHGKEHGMELGGS